MDDNASQEQDFSKLSIEDRVTHKNWKARLSGYEELVKLFPQYEDKEFQRYAPLIKKFVIDSNAAAQEKGLAATLTFIDYCPQAGKYVENIVSGIATKCLTATRAKTKELANDIVLMCVEIEKQDTVVEELIKALDQKTPKNVAAVIAMLRKCLNQFGYKVINVKPIVPVLAKLLEERDSTVREETKQLTIEIYRWIKDALVPQLSSLKPILIQELQVEFEKYKNTKAIPERLLRSHQQRQQPAAEENDDAMSTNVVDLEEAEADVDPFDLLEPVDILAKLPSEFYTLIEAKKWTERRDGLEKLQQLLEANPKLVTNVDYGELTKQIRKIIGKDTNIVVVTIAIKCMSLLANGLRKNFHNHANSSVPIILEKFKEKKANVVQALREAIDAIYLSTNLEAISEDVIASLDNKNPSIRSETALFLARSFSKTNPNLINKKLLKILTTSLIKTLSDSDAVVRESSAEALGTALKAQGDRNMAPFLQGLEGIKMSKIEEFRAKVEVKKFPNSAPPAPAKQSSIGPSKPKTAPVKKVSVASGSKLTVSSKQNSHNISNESLNDDLQRPSIAAMKIKPKVVGQIKSRLGINCNNTEGSSISSGSGSIKPGNRGSGTKIASNSRLGTLTKGLNHQSTSSLPSVTSSAITSGSTGSSNLSSVSKKQDQDSGPLMNGNMKAKDQRFADEKALKVLKWNFTTPREEFYHLLREQMTAAEWQAQLIIYCFHSDFKYHIKAIDFMREFFQKSSTEENPVVVANLDLVLKWIALRFFDTNPSVITKALELLLVVFRLCEQPHQYMLNDIEANSFIPYLVLKVGDPKDAVRNKVHDILARMRNIYPANKIFAHLFTGLQSKNARQRATCLEEISQLIELRGMSIFQPPNSLQLIKDLAKFIAERDNAVRNGALSCIVQVYFLEGERVFKLIGSLSDKEMSLVEERIKRASKNRPQQQQSHSVSNLPSTETSNGPLTVTTQSSLPTLSSATGSSSRLHTPESGRSMPQIGAINNDGQGYGLSKLHSFSNPHNQQGNTNSSQQAFDIGATFSKSRSASNLIKRSGNFTPIRPSGLINSPHKSYKFTSDETESDDNQNYQRNGNLGNGGGTPAVLDTKEILTECSKTNDDDVLDQKVKQALNLPDIKLVRRYRNSTGRFSNSNQLSSNGITDTARNGYHYQIMSSSPSPVNPELNQRFMTMFTQLSSTELQTAIEAMEHLNTALKDYEKYQSFLEPKIDQLIILCNKQYRLFLSKHYPEVDCDNSGENGQKEHRQMAENLFRSTSSVLNKLFKSPMGKKVSRDTLRELITHLLTYFAEMRNHQTVFNSVNFLIGVVFNGSDATNLFAALIRMLHDYVGNSTVQHSDKFLELTMKFVWRITKMLDHYIGELNVDQVLYESHLFFKSYPRNWWKVNNRDDIPLRTIKTLVYYIVGLKGDSILDHFNLIKNKDESELSYYVQKALRQCDKSGPNNTNSNRSLTVTNNSNSAISSKTSSSIILDPSTTNGNVKENNQHQKISEIPRTSLKNFPLKVRQINTESGETAQIPIIQNEEDLRTYVDYTAKQLNLLDLNYETIRCQGRQIHSVEDAYHAVELAKQRLNHFKMFLNSNGNDSSTSASFKE